MLTPGWLLAMLLTFLSEGPEMSHGHHWYSSLPDYVPGVVESWGTPAWALLASCNSYLPSGPSDVVTWLQQLYQPGLSAAEREAAIELLWLALFGSCLAVVMNVVVWMLIAWMIRALEESSVTGQDQASSTDPIEVHEIACGDTTSLVTVDVSTITSSIEKILSPTSSHGSSPASVAAKCTLVAVHASITASDTERPLSPARSHGSSPASVAAKCTQVAVHASITASDTERPLSPARSHGSSAASVAAKCTLVAVHASITASDTERPLSPAKNQVSSPASIAAKRSLASLSQPLLPVFINRPAKKFEAWVKYLVSEARRADDFPGVPPFIQGSSFKVDLSHGGLTAKDVGAGYFGRVLLGSMNGNSVVIKLFRKIVPKLDVLAEVAVACYLNDTGVTAICFGAALMETSGDYHQIAMVSEFIAVDKKPVSLSDLLKGPYDLTKMDMRRMAFELAQSLHGIHNKGIIHNDLKGSNIVMTKVEGRWLSFVVDFGQASYRNRSYGFDPVDDLEEFFNRYPQVAPESVTTGMVTEKSDVYSLGAILTNLASRTDDKELYALAQECRDRDPALRPDIPSLMKMMQSLPDEASSVSSRIRQHSPGYDLSSVHPIVPLFVDRPAKKFEAWVQHLVSAADREDDFPGVPPLLKGSSIKVSLRDDGQSTQDLGIGTFGRVILGFLNGDPVAIKLFRKAVPVLDVLAEVAVTSYLNETGFSAICFGAVFMEDLRDYHEIAMVVEFVAFDKRLLSISDLIDDLSYKVTDRGIRQMACDVTKGIQAVHRQGVLHNDIKGSNIMLKKIEDCWLVYLVDFGQACFHNRLARLCKVEDLEDYMGRYPQVAPENVTSGLVTEKSDVYALGAVLVNLASRSRDRDLYDLGLECRNRDPDLRPDIPALLKKLQGLL